MRLRVNRPGVENGLGVNGPRRKSGPQGRERVGQEGKAGWAARLLARLPQKNRLARE